MNPRNTRNPNNLRSTAATTKNATSPAPTQTHHGGLLALRECYRVTRIFYIDIGGEEVKELHEDCKNMSRKLSGESIVPVANGKTPVFAKRATCFAPPTTRTGGTAW